MTTTTPLQTAPVQTAESNDVTQELVTQIPNYGLTWALYIGLTFLMVGIIWYVIRKWHFVVKWFMASTIFAGALTPAHPAEGVTSYSPLVLNAVVNLFDGYKTEFMDSVKTLGIVWAIIFAVGIAVWILIKTLKSPKVEKPTNLDAVMATPIEPTIDDSQKD